MVNDLTSLTVQIVDFRSGSWELSGNTLGVSGPLGNGGGGTVIIHCGIRVDGFSRFSAFSTLPSDNPTLRLTGPVDLNNRGLTLLARSDSTVEFSGAISGNGSLNIDVETVDYFNAGTVKFSGTEANTFTGSVTLSSESSPLFGSVVGANLILDKNGAVAVPGALVIGTNAEVKLNRPNQITDNSFVSLKAGAYLRLQGNTETVGSLDLVGSWTGQTFGKSVVDTGGATLSVLGNISSINFYSNDIPKIQGKLGLPPGNHFIQVGGSMPYGLNIEAEIVGGGGFTKTGATGMFLSGNNTFDGDAVFQQGTTHLYHANALGHPSGAAILSGGVLTLHNIPVGIETLIANQPTPGATWLCSDQCRRRLIVGRSGYSQYEFGCRRRPNDILRRDQRAGRYIGIRRFDSSTGRTRRQHLHRGDCRGLFGARTE